MNGEILDARNMIAEGPSCVAFLVPLTHSAREASLFRSRKGGGIEEAICSWSEAL